MQQQPASGETTGATAPDARETRETRETEGARETREESTGEPVHEAIGSEASRDTAAEESSPEGDSEPAQARAGATTSSTGAEPAATDATRRESSAVVPVPGSHRHERPSFWKRIRLGRPLAGRALGAATQDDRMIARLDGLGDRVQGVSRELSERIQQLDDHLSEVWEVEEQLSRMMELRDMVADLQERQGRIDGRLRGLVARLSSITALAAIAAVAALASLAVALLQ